MKTKVFKNQVPANQAQQLDLVGCGAPNSGFVQKLDGPELGVFMRTRWILAARAKISYPFKICVREFSERDGEVLIARIRKRNVFARHSWENNFYLKRIRALTNKTIIEVHCPG